MFIFVFIESKMYSSDEDYFKLLAEKPSVIKNEGYLSISFIPPLLPHREEELRLLAKQYKHLTNNSLNFSRYATITGPTGSGKTTLAKRFGQILENVVKIKGFRFIYINCRIYKSPYLIFNVLLQKLNKNIPQRGYSVEELQHFFVKHLQQNKYKLLIVLDEIDYLVTRTGTDILYSLLRIGEISKDQYVSYIFIAKNTNFLKLLDTSTQSSFHSNHISLDRYSESDLIDIVRSRAELAFYKETVTDDAIRLIADIASKTGDARYAIELLWGAGHCCDNDNSPIVYPDHVRKAKSLIHPELRKEVVLTLSIHEKLTLLSILRKLKHTKNAYISTSDAISTYRLLCEEYGEHPRKHTQFWSYLNELSKQDIINCKLSGKGMKGKTTLISIPDAPLAFIEDVVLKSLTKNKNKGEISQRKEVGKNK